MKRTLTGIAAAALLLSACGDMNLKKYNPFGGDPVQETAEKKERGRAHLKDLAAFFDT